MNKTRRVFCGAFNAIFINHKIWNLLLGAAVTVVMSASCKNRTH